MVLEWLEGYTWPKNFARAASAVNPAAPWPRSSILLDPVADAMAFAHSQGVVHRDLNPSTFLSPRPGQLQAQGARLRGREIISDHALSLVRAPPRLDRSACSHRGYAAPEQFHEALVRSDRTPCVLLRGDGRRAARRQDAGLKASTSVIMPTGRSIRIGDHRSSDGNRVGDAVERSSRRGQRYPYAATRDIGEFLGTLKHAASATKRRTPQGRAYLNPRWPRRPRARGRFPGGAEWIVSKSSPAAAWRRCSRPSTSAGCARSVYGHQRSGSPGSGRQSGDPGEARGVPIVEVSAGGEPQWANRRPKSGSSRRRWLDPQRAHSEGSAPAARAVVLLTRSAAIEPPKGKRSPLVAMRWG